MSDVKNEAYGEGVQEDEAFPLHAYVEALLDNRFSLLGGGQLSNHDVKQMQCSHEETQAIINAVRQGRNQTGLASV